MPQNSLKPELWVLAFDCHWPKTDRPSLNALLDFVRRRNPAGFVFGGDQLDFQCISHHTKGKGLYRLPGSYRRDIEGFDANVLTPVERALPRGATKVWHIGNHEDWEHDLIEDQPELEGQVDHTQGLRLAQRGWRIVPLGHSSRIGKLHVAHGEILTGVGNQAGAYPAKKAVELYGAPVVCGHTHAPQAYTKISPVERVQKHMAWIAPALANVNPTYLRNRPTAWLNGIVIVETLASGNFNLFQAITTNGKFAYGGEVYG